MTYRLSTYQKKFAGERTDAETTGYDQVVEVDENHTLEDAIADYIAWIGDETVAATAEDVSVTAL